MRFSFYNFSSHFVAFFGNVTQCVEAGSSSSKADGNVAILYVFLYKYHFLVAVLSHLQIFFVDIRQWERRRIEERRETREEENRE